MDSATEDWELTSGRAASSASDDDASEEVDHGIPAALPTAQELMDAIQPDATVSMHPGATLPVSTPAQAAAGGVSMQMHSLPKVAPEAAASITTSVLNNVLENGHASLLQPQQQQPRQTQQQIQHWAPEELAHAKFWDKQIAEGKLSMLPDTTIMHINIMAWGESGLGKTTFIKNLVQGYELESMGEAFRAEGRTSAEQFRKDPGSMRLETKPIIDRGTNRGLVITIQDMPGWGDEIDLVSNLKTVVTFLLEQRKQDLLENKAGSTGTHPCPGSAMKHGITVCLYFMPPQRAKEMDWYMMEGISSLVAVVPVIAKADTHTAPELDAYRRELLQVIERASSQAAAAAAGAATADTASSSISSNSSSSSNSSASPAPSLLAPFTPYAFDPEDLSALRAANPLMPPFAVMGSQMILGPDDSQGGPDRDAAGPGTGGSTASGSGTGSTAAGAAAGSTASGPVGVPCRRYLWGDALPLNRDHSDLIILKSLLSGHQNRAVYGLLNDSWKRAHTFFVCWQHLKRVQLEARVASGQLASSPAAILAAVEGLEVNMEPLVTQVCAKVSCFGGEGQRQPLQDRLRCEEQQKLEVRLAQALKELQQQQQSLLNPWVVMTLVLLAFVLGAVLAAVAAQVYLKWVVEPEGLRICEAATDATDPYSVNYMRDDYL